MSAVMSEERIDTGRPWTPEAVARLRHIYRKHGRKAAHDAFPHRSPDAIDIQIYRRMEPTLPGRTGPWTNTEMGVLRDMFPGQGARGVQRFLPHRSLSAIYEQARRCRVRSKRRSSNGR